MANNYCQSSFAVDVHPDLIPKARQIVEDFLLELEEDEDNCAGISAEVQEDQVWIYGEEGFDPDQAARLAQILLDDLQIDAPVVFSWAYTCSKMRIDEFGGGACAVRRGKEPYFIDALSAAVDFCRMEGEV